MSLTNPIVNLNIVGADTILSQQPQRVLLIGQKTSSGSAVSGALVEDIGNASEENALFGENSMMAEMVRAFKRINKLSRLDAISLADNGSGVAATGEIGFSGTATADGTYIFYVGSSINHAYTIDVSSGDTATQIGDALEAAITADTKAPVTAVNTMGAVALTAVNKGTVGNVIGLQYVGSIAGITVTLTAMASGATDPSLTGLFSPIDNLRYQTIVYPSNYTLSTLVDFLDARFNVSNNVLDGVGITTSVDTVANLKTLGNTYNSQSLVIFGNRSINSSSFKNGAIFELPYVISSYFAAVRSLRFTENANISQYVIGGKSRDQFGGAALATLPYFNTPMPYLPLILQGDDFTQDEIDDLGAAGVSVMGNNITNNSIICGAVYTTYKTDAGGNPDISYQYLNYVDTISNIREFMYNNLKSDCRQSRLTQGDLVPNRKMHNEGSLTALFCGYYTVLSGEDYVLTQAGEDALQFFKENLSLSIDLSLGKVEAAMQVPIVTQVRLIVATLKLAFSIN